MVKPSCLIYTNINGTGKADRPIVWSGGYPLKLGKRALFVPCAVSKARKSFFILLEEEVLDET